MGLALAAVLQALPAALQAQTSTVQGPPAEISREMARELLRIMAKDLRRLVVAQEKYFTEHNAYGRVLSTGDQRQVYIVPSPGVSLTLTYVTNGTWAGRANHEWLRASCVITVGNVAQSRIPHTALDGTAPAQEGTPVCDGQ
ncbi:MAG TPA: hypothetical protein PKA50_03585 [Gemmatimonadales bacterium]|nr:hypothetical protein [Gemmatimonadales bacterium]